MQKPKQLITFYLFLFLLLSFVARAQEKNMLSLRYQQAYAQQSAWPDVLRWRKEQKAKIETAIANLDSAEIKHFIQLGQKAMDYTWPSLTASAYLDYRFTGTRVNYEALSSQRQSNLSSLAIAALLSKDQTFIPQLANGLWLTLEESTWVAPAHIGVQKEGVGLPGVNTAYIDLSASRKAYHLAMIYFLLKDQLDRYSPIISQRIAKELDERIFKVYIQQNNFFWMGFKGQLVNNWNAYNNNNCFYTLLYAVQDEKTWNTMLPKLLKSADFFINQYPADGGCDEGPSYWDMAGGNIINLIKGLNELSEGKILQTSDSLIHRMGTYTYKLHIADNKYTNFADAFATYTQNPTSVFWYGQLFNDAKLKDFAAFLWQQRNKSLPTNLVDFIAALLIRPELKHIKPKAPYPLFSALPDLEVFTGRQTDGSTQGLFYAIKGGNNNESHNHNDIGNYIIYTDGIPLLVDAGVGVYTSKTFSKSRYDIWNMKSEWHNCPSINGFNQKNGANYKASRLSYRHRQQQDVIAMDLAKAYPKEAQINHWIRTLRFDRSKQEIQIIEKYELKEAMASNTLYFLVTEKPKEGKGYLQFSRASLRYEAHLLNCQIEELPIDDARLKKSWGTKLYRISLTAKASRTKGQYKLLWKRNAF